MPNDHVTTKDRLIAKRLTVKDLAERLGVATVTVRRWIYAGEAPPHIRIGRTIRFRLEDIEAWEAERAAEQLERASARRADLRRLLQNSGQRRPRWRAGFWVWPNYFHHLHQHFTLSKALDGQPLRYEAALLYHLIASASFWGTPSLLRYMRPMLYWASARSCSAAGAPGQNQLREERGWLQRIRSTGCGPGLTLHGSERSMPNCGSLPASLSWPDSYPKDGLGSGAIGHGTRAKDHGTLISLVPYPSWIEDRAA